MSELIVGITVFARSLTEGVLCIDRFTRLCMNQQQRAHFHQLYHGTSEVIHDLCQDGEYREGEYTY